MYLLRLALAEWLIRHGLLIVAKVGLSLSRKNKKFIGQQDLMNSVLVGRTSLDMLYIFIGKHEKEMRMEK